MQTFALTRQGVIAQFLNSKGGELDYDIVCQAILVGMLLMAKRLDGLPEFLLPAWSSLFKNYSIVDVLYYCITVKVQYM